MCQVNSEKITADLLEAWEERAAILEFDAGRPVSRREAERIAGQQLGMSEDEIEFIQGARFARS